VKFLRDVCFMKMVVESNENCMNLGLQIWDDM